MSSDTPQKKRKKKLTPSETRKVKRRAEKLKGKPGVVNPFALATSQIKKQRRKKSK